MRVLPLSLKQKGANKIRVNFTFIILQALVMAKTTLKPIGVNGF